MPNLKNNNIDFLWQSFLKGDDKSFSVIYQQHIEGLLSYGHKLCPDYNLIRDCIQEIFIDLFLKRSRISVKIENLKPYLFVALRNCIGKKVTRISKFNSLSSSLDQNDQGFNIEYSFQDKIIEIEVSNEIKEKLHAAINKLPERQKEIIYLKFEEEMDYNEIAYILKISVESARKLLYRSLLSLRKIITPS